MDSRGKRLKLKGKDNEGSEACFSFNLNLLTHLQACYVHLFLFLCAFLASFLSIEKAQSEETKRTTPGYRMNGDSRLNDTMT